MRELPRQLARNLPEGTIRTNSPVDRVDETAAHLANGTTINARAVVVATDGTTAHRLVPDVPEPTWHGVTTWYFTAPASPDDQRVLVVDGESDLKLNTAMMSAVAEGYAPPGRALLAASTPDRQGDTEATVRARLSELHDGDRDWELVARYAIPRALPAVTPGRSLRLSVRCGGQYVCGDHRDTCSIQGALVSGRRAADAVRRDLSNGER
ncbi:hypothetical protein GCM10029964_065490 [Kibdelosporangium lantanae]